MRAEAKRKCDLMKLEHQKKKKILVEFMRFHFFLNLSFILLENLQSHPFLMSRNLETQNCQWYESYGYLFSRVRRVLEHSLGVLFITSS